MAKDEPAPSPPLRRSEAEIAADTPDVAAYQDEMAELLRLAERAAEQDRGAGAVDV